MTLKDKVFAKLNENIGEYISGELLSDLFGVSRNAIWKAINAIKKQGHDIESVPSKGYMLTEYSKVPTVFNIKKVLNNAEKYDLELLDSVTSTNDVLKDYAKKGAKEGRIIIALEQTEGKGRQNRKFFSPKGEGIYLSILLRPVVPIASASLITVLASCAVTEVLEQLFGVHITIKWVNDLLIDGKKFCGILTEGSINIEDGIFEHIILGIGINLTTPPGGYPQDIKDKATSLFGSESCTGAEKSEIIAKTIEKVFFYYNNIADKAYMNTYQNKQFLMGKDIEIYHKDTKTDSGIVIGVDDDGRLIVDNGKIIHISSGEARVKAKAKK